VWDQQVVSELCFDVGFSFGTVAPSVTEKVFDGHAGGGNVEVMRSVALLWRLKSDRNYAKKKEVSSIFSKNMQLRSEDEPNTCNSAKLAEVARIWKDGCIIRAIFLQRIKRHMTGTRVR
ncbi:6-phosphogluconate dehydrogenase, decarboxylating 3, partial [Tanacetum coccineum]